MKNIVIGIMLILSALNLLALNWYSIITGAKIIFPYVVVFIVMIYFSVLFESVE